MTTSARAGLLALLLVALAPAVRADDLAGMGAVLAKARETTFGALVVDERTGEALFAHGAEAPLVPASNMKVVTTAAALARLGADFAHETRVMCAAAPAGGVVEGDLVVVGDGDPTLSRRFDQDPLLADWAEALWRAGVRRVTGDVVADDRAFDDVRLHPDWHPSDAERWYGAEVGALSLNDNCVDVTVGAAGGRPTARLAPDTGYVTVEVAATLTDDRKQHVFSLLRAGPERRTIRLTGRVWSRAGGQESSVPVADPGLFLATVLRERLVARGIEVGGAARRARAGDPAPGFTLHRRLAPLPRTLAVTNQRSQNLYAECLTKTLGRRCAAGGTWPEGAKVIAEFARASGAAAAQVTVRDGSGLSRENRLSAAALVAVLRAASRAPTGEVFRASLAAPGEEGTLQRRLGDLPRGAALRGKTGTLRGVASLCGYVEVGGRRAVFAVIGNGGSGGREEADALARAVARRLLADR
ncbi:MAG: D-alanyl-D-alanine carboxypeptidase/D-alanyl-D-alanine-endopeptidase [Planctomycetes bacterium]|nr:D-alanyl-D-alanine carboxypeptidase/D-alanyl-D-alanine-endopeptidase [Planctomycetota bacterium]